ncbi:hypothetical protein TheetDRAFT_1416 [Thermoanaerobacter ethanolicus JW 200]|nr:hypothetical protein TheetDRAFT_1416 [Thermoanaerobacter ethanolicus JW 200]
MTLSPAQTNALSELAKHLYPFLPGKAHPFANQNISFDGIAVDPGLSQFWKNSSKLPAIFQLLVKTLEKRPDKFCPLILKIVQRAILYRQSKGEPITREEIEQLNELVARVGFKIPELHDRSFLKQLPSSVHSGPDKLSVSLKELDQLEKELRALDNLSPQERGYQSEKFLKNMFEIFGMTPRSPLRLIGEQIDGSFQF